MGKRCHMEWGSAKIQRKNCKGYSWTWQFRLDTWATIGTCGKYREFFYELADLLGESVGFCGRGETKTSDGETRRQRNERFNHETDDAPDIPEAVGHILEWFWQISEGRSTGINGNDRLTCTEISAWSQFTGNIIMPEEFDMIRAMDVAWCNAMSEEIKAESETNK